MARVVAYVPDLLFGSKVQAMLAGEGHEVQAVGAAAQLRTALDGGADLLVADLVSDPAATIAAVAALREAGLPGGLRLLGFFAHTDTQVRSDALAAGFDQVIPRSRMAREGADVVARMLTAAG